MRYAAPTALPLPPAAAADLSLVDDRRGSGGPELFNALMRSSMRGMQFLGTDPANAFMYSGSGSGGGGGLLADPTQMQSSASPPLPASPERGSNSSSSGTANSSGSPPAARAAGLTLPRSASWDIQRSASPGDYSSGGDEDSSGGGGDSPVPGSRNKRDNYRKRRETEGGLPPTSPRKVAGSDDEIEYAATARGRAPHRPVPQLRPQQQQLSVHERARKKSNSAPNSPSFSLSSSVGSLPNLLGGMSIESAAAAAAAASAPSDEMPAALSRFKPQVYLFNTCEVESSDIPRLDPETELAGLEECVRLLSEQVVAPLRDPGSYRGTYEPSHFLHVQGPAGSGLRTCVVNLCRRERINCIVVKPIMANTDGMHTALVAYARRFTPCVVLLSRFDINWEGTEREGPYYGRGAELFVAFQSAGISRREPNRVHTPLDEESLPRYVRSYSSSALDGNGGGGGGAGAMTTMGDNGGFTPLWFVIETALPLVRMAPYPQSAMRFSTSSVRELHPEEIHCVLRAASAAWLVSLGIPNDLPDRRLPFRCTLTERDLADLSALYEPVSQLWRALEELQSCFVRLTDETMRNTRVAPSPPAVYAEVVAIAFRHAHQRSMAASRSAHQVGQQRFQAQPRGAHAFSAAVPAMASSPAAAFSSSSVRDRIPTWSDFEVACKLLLPK